MTQLWDIVGFLMMELEHGPENFYLSPALGSGSTCYLLIPKSPSARASAPSHGEGGECPGFSSLAAGRLPVWG